MRRRLAALGSTILGAALALAALADAPRSSLRPEPRPALTAEIGAPARDPVAAAVARGPVSSLAPRSSLRPGRRSARLERAAERQIAAEPDRRGVLARLFGARPSGGVRYANAVCGQPDIAGTAVPPVRGRIAGCGIPDPVRITAVAGVRLSTPATVNCDTARALRDWVRNGVQPAFRGEVAELGVAAGYSCRTRNNRPGARLSEHATGNAIDISAFRLANGQEVTVSRGWRARGTRQAMRSAWRSACGPFGTVLGPEADRFHQDHFHLDVARYRSGPYCR